MRCLGELYTNSKRMDMINIVSEIEKHPWEPFVSANARVLIMGTFPPGSHRWSMEFYYPNPTNDFWRIMGLLYFGDKNALYDAVHKRFALERIKPLLEEHGIALSDTGYKIRRLKGNASDKYLEIVEPVDLRGLLTRMPDCRTIATTGEKAATVVAGITGTELPRKGQYVVSNDGLKIWRMPSTSRAYPLAPERKAEYYAELLRSCGAL